MSGAWLCLFFLLITYTQTVLELYGYTLVSDAISDHSIFILKSYYVSIAAFVVLLPLIFYTLLLRRTSLPLIVLCATSWALLSVVILGTSLIIADAKHLHYSLTRVPGPYYLIFPVFCLTILISSILFLQKSYRSADEELTRVKAANLMIGFAPLLAGIAVISLLMRLDVPVNAAGTLPILLGFLILMISENFRERLIYDYRVFLPWTKQFKRLFKVAKPFMTIDATPRNLKDEYEDSMIDLALERHKTQQEAARWLTVSPSTLSRKIKK